MKSRSSAPASPLRGRRRWRRWRWRRCWRRRLLEAATAAQAAPTTPQQRHADARPAPAHPPLHRRAGRASTRPIDTTGVVDFDNDQATSVLAPFSGPVTRLLVAPGDKVRQGPGAGAGRFAGFRRRHQRLSQGPGHRAERAPAGRRGQGPGAARRRRRSARPQQAQTDAASAEADRDAALQALVALNVDAEHDQGHPGRPAGRRTSKAPSARRSPAPWWKS